MMKSSYIKLPVASQLAKAKETISRAPLGGGGDPRGEGGAKTAETALASSLCKVFLMRPASESVVTQGRGPGPETVGLHDKDPAPCRLARSGVLYLPTKGVYPFTGDPKTRCAKHCENP